MGIAVLGPVTVDGSTRPLGRRDRVVLTVLASRAGRPVSVDELVDALWQADVPVSAGKVVQGCIVRLRKLLGNDAVETVAGGYRLAVPPDTVDAHRFEKAVLRARELLALGESERAAYVLTEARGLWRGRPLSDLEDWDAGRVEADRLDELRRDAEELRVEALLRAGRHAEVLAEAHTLVAEAPLRERRWALLALTLYQSGQQAAALRALHQLRVVLQRELGLDPGPDVSSLEHAILNQDPALLQDVGEALPTVTPTCPYQGLVPFDVDDAENFFGRDTELEECLARLRRDGVLVVTGPSGCGKSSLVRAGVAARLRRSGAPTTVLTPGRRPADALTALTSHRGRHAVVVDQFEELYTLTASADEQRAFLDALVELSRSADLVVAMRADRLGDVSSHAGFAALVERGLFVLVGMDADGLRAAIEQPVRQAGLLIEPGLVDLLVTEVEREPGALPLLSHVLRETWLRREGRSLTVDGYRTTGGIRGSIAQSAESVYQEADAQQRDLLRALMLRLVAPGTEGEPVRTRVPRRQVLSEGGRDLVDRLVASRLVTSDAEAVAVAHEALVRGWPRLRQWLDEDVEGQRIMHHLSDAADQWDALGRPDSELYRGVRLARALEWRERTSARLTDVEERFLDEGRRLSEAEFRDAEHRAMETARANRRLRALLAAAVAMLVLATAATLYAADQRGDSVAAAAEARATAVRADAERVGTRAQLVDDLDLSLLLGVAGTSLADTPQTRANLSAVADRYPSLVFAEDEGGYVDPMEVSPDGRLVASSDDRNRLHLYRADDGRLLRTYRHQRFPGQQVGVLPAFSADGRLLAAGTYGASRRPIRVLDVRTLRETGARLASPGLGKTAVGGLRFSADGEHLVASVQQVGADVAPVSHIVAWRLDRPDRPPRVIRIGEGPSVALRITSDGRTAFTSWPLTAWDLRTGRRTWRRPDLHAYFAMDLTRSDDVIGLYRHDDVGTPNSTLLLVDAATGQTLHSMRGHDQPRDVRFSNDGRLFATYSHEGHLIVWDVASGSLHQRWTTGETGWAVDFSADDRTLFTGGSDGMLRAWDLAGDRTLVRRTADVPGRYVSADLSPSGDRVALRWRDRRGRGWVRFADPRTGTATDPVVLPIWPGPWMTGAWAPDGSAYTSNAGCDEPPRCASRSAIVTLDPGSGQVTTQRDLPEVPAAFDEVWSMGYVDEGRTLLYGDAAGRTRLLDAATLEDHPTRIEAASSCCVTAVEEGSALLLEDRSDGASEVWRHIDVRTGEVLRRGHLALRVLNAATAPDGHRVALVGESGELHMIDLRTGRQRRSTGGPGDVLLRVDWSADGSLLVTSGSAGEVSLWDGASLAHLGTRHPPGTTGAASYAAFAGNTHDVVVVTGTGGFYRWDTDHARAQRAVCRMAGRSLTPREWQEHLPDQPYQAVCGDATGRAQDPGGT